MNTESDALQHDYVRVPRYGWRHTLHSVGIIVWIFVGILSAEITVPCVLAKYRGDSADPRCALHRPGWADHYVNDAQHHVRVSCEYNHWMTEWTAPDDPTTPESSPPVPAHPPTPDSRN